MNEITIGDFIVGKGIMWIVTDVTGLKPDLRYNIKIMAEPGEFLFTEDTQQIQELTGLSLDHLRFVGKFFSKENEQEAIENLFNSN